MKRFFSVASILSLVGSLLLWQLYHYPVAVILYHLLFISALFLFFWILIKGFRFTPNRTVRLILTHFVSFSFLFSLSLFYLVTILSNQLWGKSMELQLMLSYIPSLNSLIEALPVAGWILYTFIVLYLLSVIIIYYFVKPKDQTADRSGYKRYIITLSGILVLLIVFYQPLIHFKRYAHLSGEPLLEFIFPRMWHSADEMQAYKKQLVENRLADADCIEAVETEAVNSMSRNFLIILLDGLRPDLLSVYGYDKQTTPFLDSLKSSGSIAIVKHAFSPATSTVAGVSALFTSKEFGESSFSGLSLMKYLKLKKYTTYAFLTGQHTNWYGLANLYKGDTDNFFEAVRLHSAIDDDFVTMNKFNSTDFKQGFFAFVHLSSTHAVGVKHAQFKKYLPDKVSVGMDKKQALINNYNNGILQGDYIVRTIFEKLKKTGLLENTTIFILADHGELFGEDGRWSHSGGVHPYLHSIPLIIYDEDLSWYQNTYSATLFDVAPTVAARLGYSVPSCWIGRSLHKPFKDYEINLAGDPNDETPFGRLITKDSLIRIDLLDKQREKRRTYQQTPSGVWGENKNL